MDGKLSMITIPTEAYAWNKPDWDGQLGLKYNLRDKIIAGMELTAIGKRKEVVNGDVLSSQAGYTACNKRYACSF